MLQQIFLPKKHEIFRSYLIRLALANGFSNLYEFVKNYVIDKNGINVIDLNDLSIPVKRLYRSLKIKIPILEFYDNLTAYGFYSSMLTKKQQCELLMTVDDAHNSYIMNYMNAYRREIKYCPECYKKEKYFKTIHQFENIHQCPTHKCNLRYYRIANYKNLNEEFQSIEDTNESKYPLEFYKFMSNVVTENLHTHYDQLEMFLMKNNIYKTEMNLEDVYFKIYKKFKTAKQFLSAYQEYRGPIREDYNPFYDSYKLAVPYTSNGMMATHKHCGHEVMINDYGMKEWRCIHCNKGKLNPVYYQNRSLDQVREMLTGFKYHEYMYLDSIVSNYRVLSVVTDVIKEEYREVLLQCKRCGQLYISKIGELTEMPKCYCEHQAFMRVKKINYEPRYIKQFANMYGAIDLSETQKDTNQATK